jgi:predicted metallopeptidase
MIGSYAQSENKIVGDTIIWNENYHLMKGDFKGKPKGKNAGWTVAGIYFRMKETSDTIKFIVETIFIRSKSFLRENSPNVLIHEQLHFDITELFSRKLRQRLAGKNFKAVKNISEEIQKMHSKAMEESGWKEKNYDDDTEHGVNSVNQKEWNEKVAAEIKGLEQFSSIEVDIVK